MVSVFIAALVACVPAVVSQVQTLLAPDKSASTQSYQTAPTVATSICAVVATSSNVKVTESRLVGSLVLNVYATALTAYPLTVPAPVPALLSGIPVRDAANA